MPLDELSTIFPGYPSEAPQFGDLLLEADPDTLPPPARKLQQHLTLALNASKALSFANPMEVKRRLELGHVTPLARKWATYCLDERRHRIMVAARGELRGRPAARMFAQREVTRRVPDPEMLQTKVPLPEGGVYLVIYGGGPEVLAVRDKQGSGVAEDLADLRASAPVADVLFWRTRKGAAPELHSLVAGCGDRAGTEIPFPDAHWLAVARGEDPPAATDPEIEPTRRNP